MSGTRTITMLSVYESMAAPMLFLSGFFQSPPINFHTSEDVEIDIIRSDEDVAIVVEDLSTGYRMNSDDIYTNKRFTPPIFKEKIGLNSTDLIKRVGGDNPFQSPDFRANVITRMFNGMVKIESKIRRTMELQASQVLQTGTVTLIDSNSVALYTIDYKPKATHFPTAGTGWNDSNPTIVADLLSLINIIRNDGLENPDQLLMGEGTFEAFISDPDILTRFDNRRIDLGTISQFEMNGKGGQFRGIVLIGNYRLDVWTYGGRYKHPDTGVKTQFIDNDSCIVRSSGARLDATFGAIPNIGQLLGGQANQLLPELPIRMSSTDGGMDMSTNVWLSNDGEQLFGGVGTRVLMIPTAIDTYGNIDTNLV